MSGTFDVCSFQNGTEAHHVRVPSVLSQYIKKSKTYLKVLTVRSMRWTSCQIPSSNFLELNVDKTGMKVYDVCHCQDQKLKIRCV